jgi:hypothetical protein
LLSFKVKGDFTEEGLTITVIEQDRSLQAHSYSARILPRDLAPGWREVAQPLTRFVDKEGRSPKHWRDLDKLEIRGKTARQHPAQFARLRWLDPGGSRLRGNAPFQVQCFRGIDLSDGFRPGE